MGSGGRRRVLLVCVVVTLATSCTVPNSDPATPATGPSTSTPSTSTTPQVTVTATPSPADTVIVSITPLDAQGRLRSGFAIDDDGAGELIDATNCAEPSAAGTSVRTYACGSSALSADACVKLADGDLACLNLPWEKTLSRRSIRGELPTTSEPATPVPLGLQLEDGSRYRARNGTGAGLPPDGYVDTHYCVSGPCQDDPDAVQAVLAREGGTGKVVDTSTPAWTVMVGVLATTDDGPSAPAPQVRRVVKAWFVAAR